MNQQKHLSSDSEIINHIRIPFSFQILEVARWLSQKDPGSGLGWALRGATAHAHIQGRLCFFEGGFGRLQLGLRFYFLTVNFIHNFLSFVFHLLHFVFHFGWSLSTYRDFCQYLLNWEDTWGQIGSFWAKWTDLSSERIFIWYNRKHK